jgi:hypothetical protein
MRMSLHKFPANRNREFRRMGRMDFARIAPGLPEKRNDDLLYSVRITFDGYNISATQNILKHGQFRLNVLLTPLL